MANVVKIVFQLLGGVLVALAVGIIDLCPSGDTWLHQVAKVIERNALLIPIGALAPLGPRANQADIAFKRVPKLRQLIEAKLSQPPPRTCHSRLLFARVNIFAPLIRTIAHGSEFEKNETLSVATDSFLSE